MIGVEARNNEKRFAPHVTRLLGLFQLSEARLLTIKIRARIKQIWEAIKSGQTHRFKNFQLFLFFFFFYGNFDLSVVWIALFVCSKFVVAPPAGQTGNVACKFPGTFSQPIIVISFFEFIKLVMRRACSSSIIYSLSDLLLFRLSHRPSVYNSQRRSRFNYK